MLDPIRTTTQRLHRAPVQRSLVAAASILCATSLVACAGTTSPSAAPASAAPTTAAATAPGTTSSATAESQAPAGAVPLPDACALVTAANVSGIINQPVEAAPNTDAIIDPSIESACGYIVGDGSSGAINLFVADPGTLEGIIANLPVQPVTGLGDSAYEWDIGSLHTLAVAVGPVVIQAQLSTKFFDADVTNSMLNIAISNLRN